MKSFKFVLLWLLFLISYFIFSLGVFACFPERWLLNVFRAYYHHFVTEALWDNVFMSTVLFLAFVINIGFIFLVFIVIRALSRSQCFQVFKHRRAAR